MEQNTGVITNLPSTVIDTFEIPDEMARELDRLIIQVDIMKDMLAANVIDDGRFDKLQEKLIPLQSRYTTLKNLITYQYVPSKYNSENYSWNYPGYELTGNTCWIQRT